MDNVSISIIQNFKSIFLAEPFGEEFMNWLSKCNPAIIECLMIGPFKGRADGRYKSLTLDDDVTGKAETESSEMGIINMFSSFGLSSILLSFQLFDADCIESILDWYCSSESISDHFAILLVLGLKRLSANYDLSEFLIEYMEELLTNPAHYGKFIIYFHPDYNCK